ncbi:unnamed protein product, partial [Brenthis ino]
MIWKTILVAFLAVGVLAEYKITDEQREQYKKFIKEACTKNGAEDKVDAVEETVRTFVDCVKSMFDVDTIKNEIEEAKPRGALDEVFKKYCAKSPQLKTCLHTFTAGISPCLDPVIREHIGAADNTTDQFIDFVCHKDGDRIALFIAESGPECLKEKVGPIRECGTKLMQNVKSVDDAKKLTLTEQCAKYDEFTACTVKALEECSTPTPGNMAESLFRFVRKTSPCNKN